MVERTVRTLHEDNLQAEIEFTGRMKELKRDVDQKQAEKEEQELAFQQQLAAAESKQKEYDDYFQLAAEAQR
jgi:DNA-binding protein H-NS